MNAIIAKLKEVLAAVLPITILVLILHFTIAPLPTTVVWRLVAGALVIIVGLTTFLFGIDLSISVIGSGVGRSAAKSNKLSVVILVGLVVGFFISFAEPDLHILAVQVDSVTSGYVTRFVLVSVVSLGIAVVVAIGLLRILYNVGLRYVLLAIYVVIFVLALFSTSDFLAIAFDASGATTGALSVPFLLALAMGVASMKRNRKAAETDSFGLVAIASAGAILGVLTMSVILQPGKLQGTLPEMTQGSGIVMPFLKALPAVSLEILLALLPIALIFLIGGKRAFPIQKTEYRRVLFGLVVTWAGLVLFMTGVQAGFMDAGMVVGAEVAKLSPVVLVFVGFLLGLMTILAEPAVHVLTNQVEDVTGGSVKRKIVLFALSLGVGTSVALSMIRILVPNLQLWHILLPGYLIALPLMFFVPELFVGIAFDSGGVASGPMTATFILAFSQGAANSIESADLMADGFGMIALVAMTPLLALQLLGLVYKMKTRRKGMKK